MTPRRTGATRLVAVVAAAAARRDDAGAATDDDVASQPAPLSRSAVLRRLVAPSLAAALLAPAVAAAAAQGATATAAAAAPAASPRALRPPELAALRAAFAAAAPKSKAPVLLRLVFHDAGTFDRAAGDGGANGSVRLELDRPENGGLKRGWRVIEATRRELEKQAAASGGGGSGGLGGGGGGNAAKTAAATTAGQAAAGLASLLSDGDLIALAGAHAVEVTGGPADLLGRVRVGRADAATPDPAGRLPSEDSAPAALVAAFEAMSLSAGEMVALSGAHTLGTKGFGDPVTFDNSYYTTLLARPWDDPKTPMPTMIGLPSDRMLPGDARCLAAIERYARDQALFFGDFSDAYVRLTELGASWRPLGA